VIAALLLTPAAEAMARLRDGLDTPFHERAMGLVGIATMILIAWALSLDRKAVPWKLVGAGLALQAVFGVIVLKSAPGRWFFERVGEIVNGLLAFQLQGARFVFGNLTQGNVPVGLPGPGGRIDTAAGYVADTGSFFAFNVLPTIIFFSALMSVLYYLNVMQVVVKGIAWVMQRTLGTSGAETLSASGNIFLGQTEAPLLIRPFVKQMTLSELNTVMVGGFATVAGGVLAAYTAMLQESFPNIAGHLLAASVMNAPAGLLISKILVPETGTPVTKNSLQVSVEKTDRNVIEAAASGAAVGVQLAINVGAMLMAFIGLIAMLNFLFSWVGGMFGAPDLTVQSALGTLLRPLAFVMGVPWADTAYVGSLIGVKTTLNEFVAYAQFAADLGSGAVAASPRANVILTYALLGFANFSSIAIQIGGISGMAPERRGDLARLGLRAMVGGNLAAFMSASLAGMLA
jgi:CNT family concentrative nucleoside transporter